jgi:putative ABC transport system permease protein
LDLKNIKAALTNNIMLRNYFATSIRYFLRQPIYSSINILGLVLGLACGIFIFIWILDELSFDRYHPENEKVFKVMWNHNFSDGTITTEHWTNGLLAEALKEEIPEIEEVARLSWAKVTLFKHGEKANYEYGDYADKEIFKVLNLTFTEGDKTNPLPGNNSVAISKKMAQKYFNNESALGKVFRIDNTLDLTISSVFNDLPENTTANFQFILPFALYIKKQSVNGLDWDGSGWQSTLVKLKDKKMVLQANQKMADLVKRNGSPNDSPPPPPFLFSMNEWRLHDSFVNGKQSGGRINYVVSFSLVAILILMIACINFMNLSTARSVNRSREVGIRKVAGASRGAIIKQFLAESILLSFISLFIALLLVQVLLPLFNNLAEKQLSINYDNPALIFGLMGITMLTGIISGSYPAFFLSAFRPSSVLKGNLQSAFSGIAMRRGLVVCQFALSIVIIVCAVGVNEQINFLSNKNLGFDKRNVMSLRTNEDIVKGYEVFRNKLLQNQAIQSVAIGDAHPMEINGQGYYEWDGKSSNDDTFFNQAHCDYDYLQTLGFSFLKGRNFSRNFPSDSNNFVITEQAANHIGYTEPIGKRLKIEEDGVIHEGQIIGVLADFHNLPIHDRLQPTVFALGKSASNFGEWGNIFIKYKEGKVKEVLDHVSEAYKIHSPDLPIQYGFVDQDFEKQFQLERMVATLSF